jgi:hypothetical protein
VFKVEILGDQHEVEFECESGMLVAYVKGLEHKPAVRGVGATKHEAMADLRGAVVTWLHGLLEKEAMAEI